MINLSIHAGDFDNKYLSCTLYKQMKNTQKEVYTERQARTKKEYKKKIMITELEVIGIKLYSPILGNTGEVTTIHT